MRYFDINFETRTGLDYALLRKIQDESKAVVDGNATSSSSSNNGPVSSSLKYKDVPVYTAMGQNLKALLLRSGTNSNMEAQTGNETAVGGVGTAGTKAFVLSGSAFEFDLKPESEQEIPTIIARSKQVGEAVILPILSYLTYEYNIVYLII